MAANLTDALDFHSKALVLRAERQRIIASNIANADTPGYVGRDINFNDAMSAAMEGSSLTLGLQAAGPSSGTHANHIALQPSTASLGAPQLAYTVQSQPAMDGNSVDMDRERANFVDNSIRYEATLRFINGQSKTILSAIQGQ
ncbi:MAG: flagellar basal body rod protein FlgB [Rhodoferax sp.]